VKIKKLIKDIPNIQLKGPKEIEITGVCLNSKLVAPGNLFIAKKGRVYNGAKYIDEAIAAGAVAVATDIYDPFLKDIAQLVHPKIASIEGALAAHYYQFPSQELLTAGITGTNGKTTTSFFVKHLLEAYHGPCGLIGTIEYIIGNSRYQAVRTTPDICSNHKMLREMVYQGCRSAVMEVTSHALDQGRVEHIDFDIAIFTNLSLDHLDYHKTMENYANAKQKLFSMLNPSKKKRGIGFPKTAIMNGDSEWTQHMAKACKGNLMTFGMGEGVDLRAIDIQFSPEGSQFQLLYQGQKIACRSPLIGQHNIYNFMAAFAVGLVKRIPIQSIVETLAKTPPIPGRLERIPNAHGIQIFVDFAHTDDALKNVFKCLQDVKQGKLLTVFGCGGERDRSKRPKMAAVAEQFSDLTIITTDNPRSEDPETIAREIMQGFTNKEKYIVELDRRQAIKMAIQRAKKGDVILIAGKGHEPYQIFAHKTVEFDDRIVAAELCQTKQG
jgi:UDP-N-acetylmuramoyl-L-alanyl-D-glutamate--2,6-diaminopimelate ligase